MKIKYLIPTLATATTLGTNAAIIMEDSFEIGGAGYTAGDLVGQNPAIAGATGNWFTNAGNSQTVSATGLSYANLQTSGGSVDANDASGQRNGRNLSVTYTDASDATVYISFLMQLGEAGGNGSYRAFELHDTTLGASDGGMADGTNRQFQLGVHNGDFGTNGIGFRAANDGAFDAELSATRNLDVNLFVIKLELSSTAASDSATVWMNPTTGTAGDPASGGVTVSGFDITFDTIALARFAGDGTTWDELRVGDTFLDVTPVPEPSSTALLGLGGLALILRRRK
ncbi:MAG: PEP-CTERM sorting domain-containing protein [Akkermansiaceae bacterium]